MRYRKSSIFLGAAAAVIAGSLCSAQTTQQSNYTYDALGRLTSESDSDSTYVQYSYDPAGNRTQLSLTGGTNHPPVANPDTVGTVAATKVTFDPRLNDTDPDGDSLSIASAGTPSRGTVNFTGSSVSYTPNYGWIGTDSFSYTITDGRGGTATSTITINVTASQAPPVAVNETISLAGNTNYSWNPLTQDSDPNGFGLTVTGVTQGGHGAVAFTGSAITYTPSTGWYGTDNFSYTISDGHGGSATGGVTANVSQPYSPPTAKPDGFFVGADIKPTQSVVPAATTDPRANDVSPLGYALTITGVTQPARGTVTFTGTSVTYTYYRSVSPTYTDSDSFTYTISDGHGGTSTATITVTIDVEPTSGICDTC